MPTAATTGGGTRQNTGGNQQTRAVPTVPFIRASAEHIEPTGIDESKVLTANAQNLGVFDIPAYGYMRSLVLLVEATGGVTATGTEAINEDAPWNVLQDIALTEPNGSIIAQFNSGYELYLANKWGGFRGAGNTDPRNYPAFSAVNVGASGTGNFSFLLRVPVELSERDGLGSLPNQNAAATFKLRLNLAPVATVFSTFAADGTYPTVRVRVFLEAWDQPESAMAGATNQVTPPAMNTTQFWSTQSFNVNSGEQTIRLTRVGNYIRNLIFVYRDDASPASRATGETEWPDPLRLYLDTRPVLNMNKLHWEQLSFERTGYGASGTTDDAAKGKDAGVFVLDMTHEFDGTLGHENRDLWLPTLGSSRLEVQGNFGGSGGTLTVLTNDVAIAGPVFM